MTRIRSLLVVGAGLAGAQAAAGARRAGYDGRITIVGDEPHLPYQRPPLSKAVLRGQADAESTRLHEDSFYADNAVELVTGDRVLALESTLDVPVWGAETASTSIPSSSPPVPRRAAWTFPVPVSAACTTCGLLTTPYACVMQSRRRDAWRSSVPGGSGPRSRRLPANSARTSF